MELWSPVGTVPDRSPLPRRSVMDAVHWAASPEPAGETLASLVLFQRAPRAPGHAVTFPALPQVRSCRAGCRSEQVSLAPGEHPQFLASFLQERREKAPFGRKVRSLPASPGLGKGESIFMKEKRERDLGRRNRRGGFFREFPCGAWRLQSRSGRIGKRRPGGDFI